MSNTTRTPSNQIVRAASAAADETGLPKPGIVNTLGITALIARLTLE
jgi:hypothetical protein